MAEPTAHGLKTPEENLTAPEAAEERFRLLVESVRDYGIFLLDPKGFITSWNAGAERMKGYTASQIIGRHFSIFYTPEDIQRNHPQNELELARKHGRYEEEGWRVRKDGSRFWANVVITALTSADGVFRGFAKVTRDLTERRAAEEQLRVNEERIRRMFEGVKDYAMIMLSPEGHIVSWNEGARRIKGYEPQEIIGQHFSKFYPEADVQMGKCEYELVEAAETGRFEDEGWRIRKDGTKFWASVIITAMRDSHGKLMGYSKVTRDMTDRKRADDLLKMAYANLEKRVEERTRELTTANERLRDAIQVRDEFLSIASHELRTPITPLKLQIQSFLQHVRKGTVSQLSPERMERMALTCERSLSRLAGLIDNLLDVSRINTGRLVLACETFNVTEMAQEILERYRNQIVAAGCEISLEAREEVSGSFDRLRLEQVFVNLLTNALKYGEKRPVRIKLYAAGGHLVLEFSDNGMGIAREDQQRIFERFERIDTGTTISGLGLGLYITKQIIEAHGGDITVDSAPGAGSTFRVKLPLRDHEVI